MEDIYRHEDDAKDDLLSALAALRGREHKMTIREFMATTLLQGILANPNLSSNFPSVNVEAAVLNADALLERLAT